MRKEFVCEGVCGGGGGCQRWHFTRRFCRLYALLISACCVCFCCHYLLLAVVVVVAAVVVVVVLLLGWVVAALGV